MRFREAATKCPVCAPLLGRFPEAQNYRSEHDLTLGAVDSWGYTRVTSVRRTEHGLIRDTSIFAQCVARARNVNRA